MVSFPSFSFRGGIPPPRVVAPFVESELVTGYWAWPMDAVDSRGGFSPKKLTGAKRREWRNDP